MPDNIFSDNNDNQIKAIIDKANAPKEPVVQEQSIDFSDTKEQAALLLGKILDTSSLHGVSDYAIRRLTALAPQVMIYDLPDLVNASSGLAEAVTLTPEQMLYLFLCDAGYSPQTACLILGITKSKPVLWRKQNILFSNCLKAIMAALADEAEAMTASLATTDSKASIERMFFIKAHKPEYRENAPIPAEAAINLRITVDGQDIDVTAGFRQKNGQD